MKSALGMCNTAPGFKQIHIVGVLERYFVGKTVCELVHAKIHPASDAATKPAAVNERVTEPRHGRNGQRNTRKLCGYGCIDIRLGVKILNDIGLDTAQNSCQTNHRSSFSQRIPTTTAQFPFDVFCAAGFDQIVP